MHLIFYKALRHKINVILGQKSQQEGESCGINFFGKDSGKCASGLECKEVSGFMGVKLKQCVKASKNIFQIFISKLSYNIRVNKISLALKVT